MLSEFLSWHLQVPLSCQTLHMVLDHLVLLGDLFYLEFRVDQVALVHPMDKKKKKKKGNLDFRTFKHIILKWNLNSGPSSIVVQSTGEVKICMIILPTNILYIHNIWLQWTRNVAVGKENSRDCGHDYWKRRGEGGLQMWEEDSWATERVWYVWGCLCFIWMEIILLCFLYHTEMIPLIPQTEQNLLKCEPWFLPWLFFSIPSLRNFHYLFPKIPLIPSLFIS